MWSLLEYVIGRYWIDAGRSHRRLELDAERATQFRRAEAAEAEVARLRVVLARAHNEGRHGPWCSGWVGSEMDPNRCNCWRSNVRTAMAERNRVEQPEAENARLRAHKLIGVTCPACGRSSGGPFLEPTALSKVLTWIRCMCGASLMAE